MFFRDSNTSTEIICVDDFKLKTMMLHHTHIKTFHYFGESASKEATNTRKICFQDCSGNVAPVSWQLEEIKGIEL